MRKKYIVPSTVVMQVFTESPLNSGSGDGDQDFAKKHRFFFDDWDNEEEETPSFPRSKSVWDD